MHAIIVICSYAVLSGVVAGATCGVVIDVRRLVFGSFRRRRLNRIPPNVVDGMLMPYPTDDRWQRRRCTSKRCPGRWVLGKVEVCQDHGLFIGGEQIEGEQADRYESLVLTGQRERLALAAATGEDTH